MKDSLKELILNEKSCFFLEGQSEKELLQGLSPRLLDNHKEVDVKYIVFQGKQDLEKKILRPLEGVA